MKLKITEEKDNPVLKRKELKIDVDYESKATPSRLELTQVVSKEKNVSADKIEVRKITSNTGLPSGKALVMIWQEIPEYIKQKLEKKKPKPKEEKKQEPKKEVPKEEPKKQEAKPEEKKEEPKEEKEKPAPKEKEEKKE